MDQRIITKCLLLTIPCIDPIYFDFEQEDSNSNDDYWLGMEYKPGIGVVQATL